MTRRPKIAPTAALSIFAQRSCAIGSAVAIAVLLGCVPTPPPARNLPHAAPPPLPPAPQAAHPLTGDQSGFLRLGNIPREETPVRVGVLLPFSNGSAATRALAASLMKAAELALFDSKKRDLILISSDEGSDGVEAAAGARTLLAEGAEIIIGPLFAQSVSAVAPITRDRGVPLISFSTDRAVAGGGVYLLSFLPANEVKRIVSYAAQRGHSGFAAMIPRTAYGARVAEAFRDTVRSTGGRTLDAESFLPETGDIAAPALKVAQSKPDAILIAQGGVLLRDIASALAADGAGSHQVQFLGTGLWDDPATSEEPSLAGGWFAAPDPEAERSFDAKYRAAFGSNPPALSTLAYDAVSLVALLSSGPPYHRFTRGALMDANGFSGVDGIFRFNPDGTSERGLAILSIEHDGGFVTIDPAPITFQGSAPAG
ncbi:MAG TPA: penicillin-binding protein activator [Rhizomicrobium sp.]